MRLWASGTLSRERAKLAGTGRADQRMRSARLEIVVLAGNWATSIPVPCVAAFRIFLPHTRTSLTTFHGGDFCTPRCQKTPQAGARPRLPVQVDPAVAKIAVDARILHAAGGRHHVVTYVPEQEADLLPAADALEPFIPSRACERPARSPTFAGPVMSLRLAHHPQRGCPMTHLTRREALTVFAAMAATASASRPAEAAVQTGRPAPDFTATDSRGATHTLAGYRGKAVNL